MSGASKIGDLTAPYHESTDPLSLLFDQLQDLLVIHYEVSQLQSETEPPKELGSIFLTALRYVYGEKSAAKSSMRFELNLNTDAEGASVDVPLILELNVRNAKCSQKPSAPSGPSLVDY